MISFEISDEDARHRDASLNRAAAVFAQAGRPFDRLHHSMNLTACHANGCPLDFAGLAAADDFNIMHDVIGIDVNLDRDDDSVTSGKLLNHFLPRFARKHAA